jgi:hypothetical protein
MEIEVLRHVEQGEGPDRETLYLIGGIAMVMLGAGLLLCNPRVREYLSDAGLGKFVAGAIPDLERYFRLRSM